MLGGYLCLNTNSRAKFDVEPISLARHGICVLYPNAESESFGVISFSQENITTPTKIVAGVRGLNPNSSFGMQLLENGDITEGLASLGGSFLVESPGKSGSPFYKHSGDLGNIMTNEKGAGYMAFTHPFIKLFGENNVFGRSCGVYSERNDEETGLQKGQLLAAGIIGRSASFKNLPPF